jgi:glycerate kinase
LSRADWVLSGEGRLDAQSLSGKLPLAVAGQARFKGKCCLLVAGEVKGSSTLWRAKGADKVIQLRKKGMGREASIRGTSRLLEEAAFQFASELA